MKICLSVFVLILAPIHVSAQNPSLTVQETDLGAQPDLLSAAPILFQGGTHTLTILARDTAGATTRAVFALSTSVVATEPETWGGVKALYEQ